MTKIAIVIPCINLWAKYTKPTIDSALEAMVRAKPHDIDCHILLIDNASTDETATEALKMVSELFTYRRNTERWGFQKSVNYGVNEGFKNGADIALVLNNDVILHPEFIWRIGERFEKGDVEMVTGMPVDGEMKQRNMKPSDISFMNAKDKESLDEPPHPCFSAFALNKECWDTVGEFDEVFAPAYFEDNDYHYRIQLAGLLAILHPPAMFYHFGSRTQMEANENGRAMVPSPMFENNRAAYIKKWGGMPSQEKFEHPYNDSSLLITDVKQTTI